MNKALDTVKDTKFLWNYGDEKPPVKWQLYSWYYAALGIFQSSQLLGRRSVWIDWNKDFQQALVYNQADDGHWEVPPHSANEQGKGSVYATVMCTLMLEVYYRYLPIYQIDQSSAASPRQTAHLTTTP